MHEILNTSAQTRRVAAELCLWSDSVRARSVVLCWDGSIARIHALHAVAMAARGLSHPGIRASTTT